MLSIQENAEKIATALRENAIALPESESPDEAELERIGEDILRKLEARSSLLPSFWSADGDESERIGEALDGFAKITPTLYFSLVWGGADPSERLGRDGGLACALEAKERHWWINAMRAIRPSSEMRIGLGRAACEAMAQRRQEGEISGSLFASANKS